VDPVQVQDKFFKESKLMCIIIIHAGSDPDKIVYQVAGKGVPGGCSSPAKDPTKRASPLGPSPTARKEAGE